MGFRDACTKFYRAAQKVIAPNLKYSQLLYEQVLFDRSSGKAIWLDLGCGRGFLPPWREEQERDLAKRPKALIGLDYDAASLRDNKTIDRRVRGDVSCLPFGNAVFDLVTSNMVFEHLREPQDQLKDIFRILKPGGELVFHTPNSRGYGPSLAKLLPEAVKDRIIWYLQRRKPEDIFPTYYRINTPEAIDELASSVGFSVVSLRLIVSTPMFIMIPPLLLLELVFIRFLMTRLGRPFRSNIIAVLRKPLVQASARYD